MRKRKKLTLLLLTLLFVLSLSAQGFEGRRPPHGDMKQPPTEQKDFSNDNNQHDFQGYLVDCNWGKKGTDANGRDIAKKPSLITLKHLRSEESIKAGYGILMKLHERGSVFARFDTSGNLRAEDFIHSCKKKSKILVHVKGYMSEDHIISVTDLEAASSMNQHDRMHAGNHMGPQGPNDKPGGGMPGSNGHPMRGVED